MQKPSWKWVLVFNLVLDLPMAIVMSISATLLNKAPLVFFPNLLSNIIIGFVLAFLINVILPIPLISAGFAGLFKIKPHTIGESLVGGLPVCLIFTFGIGLPLSIFNIFVASKNVPGMTFSFGAVWGSFIATFIPLYIILYIVAFIMTPIAATCATNACKK
jgi:hypothetical protein